MLKNAFSPWLRAWWPLALGLALYAMSCAGPSWSWDAPIPENPVRWRYFQFVNGGLYFGTGVQNPRHNDATYFPYDRFGNGFQWSHADDPSPWIPWPTPVWNNDADIVGAYSEHFIPLWYVLIPMAWLSWRRWKKRDEKARP